MALELQTAPVSCLLFEALDIADCGNIRLNTKSKNHNKGLFTLLVAGERVIESRSRQWCYFVGKREAEHRAVGCKNKSPDSAGCRWKHSFVPVWKVWGEWVIGTEVLKSGFLLKGSKSC